MPEPAVKGTLYQNLSSELCVLIQSGRIAQADCERILEPEELQGLDRDVAIGAWYPLDAYERMLNLYVLAAPRDPREFVTQSGRESADRVIELGIYSQLDDRTKESWEHRIGRILLTLSGSFFNFGAWEWSGFQGESFVVTIRHASCMPDLLAWRTAGFVERLGQRAAGEGDVVVNTERSPDRDTVIFRGERTF
jgi:hypothetical protein